MSGSGRVLGALLAITMVLAVVPAALGVPAPPATDPAGTLATDVSDLEVVEVTPLDDWVATSGDTIQVDEYPLTEDFDTLSEWTKFPAADNEWELSSARFHSAPTAAAVIDSDVGGHDDSLEYAHSINLGSSNHYQLRFWRWILCDPFDDSLIVEAKVGALGIWETVGSPLVGYGDSWRYETLDLTEYANKPSVYLRFRWNSDVWNWGGYVFIDDVSLVRLENPHRVAGANRYTTAVKIAREGFDADQNPVNGTQWENVDEVILASGEDRAAADPLTAAGLCKIYHAPLFLVPSTSVPAEVEAAVNEICEQNGGVVGVHMVGGTTSLPTARFNELNTAIGGGIVMDRILATGSRYDLAAAIAERVGDAYGGTRPIVLIANGADSTKFFDALALSPITAAQGYPILLVTADSVPAATANAIAALEPSTKIIGGGPNTVSDAVKTQLGAVRWSGSTRYTTATRIASNAISSMWLDDDECGIAAKLPDALTGGSMIGMRGGALVLTSGTALTPDTATWLNDHGLNILRCWVFGGPNSVSNDVVEAIPGALK